MEKAHDMTGIYRDPVFRIRFCGVPVQVMCLHKDFDSGKEERYYYPHKHLTYELHCVNYGASRMQIGGRKISIKEGEFCLITPGIYHMNENIDDSFNKLCMNIQFDWEMAEDPDRRAELFSILTSEKVFYGKNETFLPVLDLLFQDVGKKNFLSMEAVCAELALLLTYLIRSIGKDEMLKGRHDAAMVDLNRLRILRIDEFFCSEFTICPKAEALAGSLGISERQLDRILTAYYGKNFREKLSESRIEVASDMLRNSERTIEEIAECLSYSDASNFSSFFKKKMGMSPLAYRMQSW